MLLKFTPFSLQAYGKDPLPAQLFGAWCLINSLNNHTTSFWCNQRSYCTQIWFCYLTNALDFLRALLALQVDVPSCFVGLVLENCKLPYPNHGHVILADPSPILFYPISSTEIRCLVDVPGKKIPSIANGELANYLKTSVAPQVYLAFKIHYTYFSCCYSSFHFSKLSCFVCFQLRHWIN